MKNRLKNSSHGTTKINTICRECHVDRKEEEIYYKFRSDVICKHCLINGLTRHADRLFSDPYHEDEEAYYRKCGFIWDQELGDYVRLDG